MSHIDIHLLALRREEVFWQDGIEFRRYKNGKIRPVRRDPHTGKEIIFGKPIRKNRI